jgi:hypothetical protein
LIGLDVEGIDFGLKPIARDVAGDPRWAAMIFFWFGTLKPEARFRKGLALAIALCALVEVSQLYHPPNWMLCEPRDSFT